MLKNVFHTESNEIIETVLPMLYVEYNPEKELFHLVVNRPKLKQLFKIPIAESTAIETVAKNRVPLVGLLHGGGMDGMRFMESLKN